MDYIEKLQEQIKYYREIGDLEKEYLLLGELGNVFFLEKRLSQAIESYTKALTIAKAIHDLNGESSTLSNIGNVYTEMGEAGQAIKLHEEALRIARKIENHPLEGNIINNLGLTLTSLGRKREAENAYRDALAIAQKVEDQELEQNVLCNLELVSERAEHLDRSGSDARQSNMLISDVGAQGGVQRDAIQPRRELQKRTRWFLTFNYVLILTILGAWAWLLTVGSSWSSVLSIIFSVIAVLLSLAQLFYQLSLIRRYANKAPSDMKQPREVRAN